jgi:hypothetical protein
MITGALSFTAVSIVAFMLLEPITFTAGSAYLFSFACAKISETKEPVATPAGKILSSCFFYYC